MKRRLLAIGILAAVMAVVGTGLVIAQLPMRPGPDWNRFSWPLYIRVVIVSVALWVAIGSVFIRRQSSAWTGVVAGLISPVVGVIAVNPLFLFILRDAPWQFAGVGLATGVLVWLVARLQSPWLDGAA
jgi:hypothetical protein